MRTYCLVLYTAYMLTACRATNQLTTEHNATAAITEHGAPFARTISVHVQGG